MRVCARDDLEKHIRTHTNTHARIHTHTDTHTHTLQEDFMRIGRAVWVADPRFARKFG